MAAKKKALLKAKPAPKKGPSKQKVARKPVPKKAVAKVAGAAQPKNPAASPMPGPPAPRAPGEKRYWLLKTEPDVFSFADLLASPNATTFWDGVRNYQARNSLRDQMKTGDGVLIYHSRAEPMAIVGVA